MCSITSIYALTRAPSRNDRCTGAKLIVQVCTCYQPQMQQVIRLVGGLQTKRSFAIMTASLCCQARLFSGPWPAAASERLGRAADAAGNSAERRSRPAMRSQPRLDCSPPLAHAYSANPRNIGAVAKRRKKFFLDHPQPLTQNCTFLASQGAITHYGQQGITTNQLPGQCLLFVKRHPGRDVSTTLPSCPQQLVL